MLVLSIKPVFATAILRGEKTVELRRRRPCVKTGDIIIVYASSPIMAILGMCEVDSITSGHPRCLWPKVRARAGMNWREYSAYFEGTTKGTAICLRRPHCLEVPVTLDEIRRIAPRFRPPQSYRYFRSLSSDLLTLLREITNQPRSAGTSPSRPLSRLGM